MSFFSDVSSFIGGGSESSSQNSSQSGFALLPPEIQSVFKNYAGGLEGLFAGGASDELFKPLPQTLYEDKALGTSLNGVTATPDSLAADISMQMNPFDQHVINTINREAGGEYSVLKQGLDEAGQFGSNRHILGANDIEAKRLDQIGTFKQGQYNKALDNTLNQLTSSRAGDVGLQFGAGDFVRGLDTDTKQAPINAYRTFGQLLGVLPTSGGSTSQGTSKSSSTEGIGDAVSGIASAFALSDMRLKENIVPMGTENGYPIYKFNYINIPEKTYIGVLAQDVEKIKPEAVSESEGMKRVNYSLLGVKMREAA